MNRAWILIAFAIVALFPWSCDAMSASQQSVFEAGRRAFTLCENLQGVHVLQSGEVVCLRGHIDAPMFINLMKAKDGIAGQPYVVISGPGGDVNASIYIVRVLDKYDPIPVTGDMCASACAQFLFLMGRQRVMLHCANVAMHGGPDTVEKDLALPFSDKVKMAAISTDWRFEKFYQDRGVSLDMVRRPPPNIQKRREAGQVVFWPWSINKLRSFGVKGIISENDTDDVVPKDYAKVCIKHLPAAAKSAGT